MNLKKIVAVGAMAVMLASCSGAKLDTPEKFIESHLDAQIAFMKDTFKAKKESTITSKAKSYCNKYVVSDYKDVCVTGMTLIGAVYMGFGLLGATDFDASYADLAVTAGTAKEGYEVYDASYKMTISMKVLGQESTETVPTVDTYDLVKKGGSYKMGLFVLEL